MWRFVSFSVVCLGAMQAVWAQGPTLSCAPLESVGEAGSGVARQVCHHPGASLADAYRALLAHERAQGRDAVAAQALPPQLPASSTAWVAGDQARYQVQWQGADRVTVQLVHTGDLEAQTRYALERQGAQVRVVSVYEAP